jgi:hypothetical protein
MVDPGLDDTDVLLDLLPPSPAGTLEHYRVSRDVGKIYNDGRICWSRTACNQREWTRRGGRPIPTPGSRLTSGLFRCR